MGMSFLVHGFLVIFLILWGYCFSNPGSGDGQLRRGSIVLSVQTDDQENNYLDETDLMLESEEDSQLEQTNPVATPPPALFPQFETTDQPELPGFESLQDNDIDANQMAVLSGINSASEYELSESDLKLIESDQRLLRSRAPQGEPATISVFGSGRMTGRSFVFVIDRSHSMGSQGLGVIMAAREELSAAINQLEPHHYFQIVGYHENTVTMSNRQLLPASPSNKLMVPGHIANLSAFGATNHENGLIAAAAFKPDVIVFLTDGGYPELNSGQLAMIHRIVPRNCQIHCVQFGVGSQQKKINFMTRLADQNDGTFRYIDVTEWKNGY